MPDPLYTPRNVATPAYHLRFTWSGWPSNGEFPPLPPLDELTELWESDGLRPLEHRVQPQLSAMPNHLHLALRGNIEEPPGDCAGVHE